MIGRAKDVAAAAVLVAAGGAALVGALLFARHLFHLS
jgi:diacylglycerol kinase